MGMNETRKFSGSEMPGMEMLGVQGQLKQEWAMISISIEFVKGPVIVADQLINPSELVR